MIKVLTTISFLIFMTTNPIFADTKRDTIKILDTLIDYTKKMNFDGFGNELDEALISKMGLKFSNKSNDNFEMLWYEGGSVLLAYVPKTRGLFSLYFPVNETYLKKNKVLDSLETATTGYSPKVNQILPSLLITKKMFPPKIYNLKYFDTKGGNISLAVNLKSKKQSLLDRFLYDIVNDILKFYPEIKLDKILKNYRFKTVDANNYKYIHYTDKTEINVTRIKNKILITANNLNINKFKKSFQILNNYSSINNTVPLMKQPDGRYEFVKLNSKKSGSLSIKIDVRGEEINLKTLNPKLLSGIRILFRE